MPAPFRSAPDGWEVSPAPIQHAGETRSPNKEEQIDMIIKSMAVRNCVVRVAHRHAAGSPLRSLAQAQRTDESLFSHQRDSRRVPSVSKVFSIEAGYHSLKRGDLAQDPALPRGGQVGPLSLRAGFGGFESQNAARCDGRETRPLCRMAPPPHTPHWQLQAPLPPHHEGQQH
ncbi:hypothetical protein AAFF_G00146470 [Aldrovandia affinis]|uniref:Uncharacterized protein n=1 Tax=Aldrovandia affinis TaxID=143900 RepID=A0AAD7RPR0_9TELE|nr:hypothetical protein AAFF_G00146470 [Aldrovandia affinis]